MVWGAHGQYTQLWHTEINGEGDFSDQINHLAVDNNGNTYVAGFSVNVGTDRDFLVAKINASGQLLWSREFSAPGNGPDEAKKILIHPNGNIIVSGYGNNKFVGNDFWTMAFNPQGDTLWTRLHNSSATNLYDEPNDMAIDANGNIFIAGDSDNDPTMITNNDFMLVKYTADGTFLWEQKLNGPANGDDRCAGLDINSSNEIYLTGRSFNGGDDDFLTVKYNNNGTLLWSKTIDNGGTDRAVDIEVAANDNIYITGRSDNGTDDDYFSVIYNSSGTIIAQAIYDYAGDDRPVALTTLANGDFIVTGKSDGNITTAIDFNTVTVKFDATGNILWSKTFSNVALSDDIPTAIVSDANGNIVVAGFSDTDATANINNEIFVCAYNSGGTILSTYVSNNNPGTTLEDAAYSVAFKASTVVVGGCKSINDISSKKNAFWFEYNFNSGTIINTAAWNGKGDNTDNVRDILVDPAGNSYVCGYTVSNLTSRDFFIAKLLANGSISWRNNFTGTLFGSDDEANALAFDNAGNIIVSGFIKNSGTSSDIVILKYSPAGVLLWTVNYDGPVHESDKTYAMSTDAAGNTYITGKTDIDPSWQINDEIFTAKYSSTGTVVWTKTYTGIAQGIDKGQFIEIGASGNIYVVGKIQNGMNDNIIALKYSSAGAQIWSTTVDISGANDKINDCTLDANENLIICGSSETASAVDHNCFTTMINSSGTQMWQIVNGNLGTDNDENIAICTDNSFIFAAQNIDSDPSIAEEIHTQVQKIDLNGNVVNTYLYNSNYPSISDDILIDNYNTPIVLAHANPVFPSDIDYQIELLKVFGAECTLAETFSTSDSIDVGNVFTYLPNQLFVGGSTWHYLEQRNAMVVKYSFSDTQGVPEYGLKNLAVYPNPFTNRIQFSANEELNLLRVYNSLGEIVFTNNPYRKSGSVELPELPAGCYIIQGQGNHSLFTKQLIKE